MAYFLDKSGVALQIKEVGYHSKSQDQRSWEGQPYQVRKPKVTSFLDGP